MKKGAAFGMLMLLICATGAGQELQNFRVAGRSLVVPAGLAPLPDEPIKCGFPIIAHALMQAAASPEGRQAAIAGIQSRPVMQASKTSGAFCIHFDTTGSNTPALLDASGSRIEGTARAYVDSMVAILAYAYSYETGTLQYPAPPPDDTLGGGPECDIYVMELGSMYGYTTPDQGVVEGATSTSFITIDNDFVFVRPAANRGIPGLKVTLAHEFHHAIQVGNYGYWYNDAFYYEITSTWMEDVVYPAVNDYYNYTNASWGHLLNPETPFTANTLIMYSRATWGHYIAKRFGTSVMRETWEHIRTARPQLAIDQTLRIHGSDFGTAYGEWCMWNYFTAGRASPVKYFTDGADYRSVAQSVLEFNGASDSRDGGLQSLASRYYLVERGNDTMTVIVANTDVAGTVASTNPLLQYTLRLQSTGGDATYLLTPIGIFGKLEVANSTFWSVFFVTRDSTYQYVEPAAMPFPVPFHPGKQIFVYLPAGSAEQQQGSVCIFNAAADLVRDLPSVTSTLFRNRQVFTWDGRTNDGSVASTGIYFYVISAAGKELKGKIVVVRE
jgi:hypothetical protein